MAAPIPKGTSRPRASAPPLAAVRLAIRLASRSLSDFTVVRGIWARLCAAQYRTDRPRLPLTTSDPSSPSRAESTSALRLVGDTTRSPCSSATVRT